MLSLLKTLDHLNSMPTFKNEVLRHVRKQCSTGTLVSFGSNSQPASLLRPQSSTISNINGKCHYKNLAAELVKLVIQLQALFHIVLMSTYAHTY